jgi:hypothetical protein
MGGCNGSGMSKFFKAYGKAGGASEFGQNVRDAFSGCGLDRTALVNSSSQIIATAIVTSINQCNSFEGTDQQVNIGCHPKFDDPTEVYEQNPACGACNQNVFNGMASQHALERSMWATTQPAKVRTPIDTEFQLVLDRLASCGTSSCKACALMNVTQYNVLSQSSRCYAQIQSVTNFQSNLSSLVNQELLTNQDVLAAVAAQLQTKDVSHITQNIVSNISSLVNEQFLTSVVNQMQSQQVIRINTAGGSINNISQFNAYNVAMAAVTDAAIAEQAMGSQFFTAVSQVTQNQTTLNDIGEIIFASTITFTEAIQNIVGQVMLACIILLASVVLIIVGLLVSHQIRARITNNNNNDDGNNR